MASKKKEGTPDPGQKKKTGDLASGIAQEIKEDLNITPQTVTQAVIQDAKQAVNYEIRRGFRNLLKGIFR